MTWDDYEQALDWAKFFQGRGTQGELNLAGIGESTMHPDLIPMVNRARAVLGPKQVLLLATNGLLITEEMVAALVPSQLRVYVSMHRPEKAGPAVHILKKHGLLFGVSQDPAMSSIDWAGQVDWNVTTQKGRACMWVRGGLVFVMADGRVSRCCLDSTGVGVFGTIRDDLSKLTTSPYILCKTCDQDVGVPM